MSDAAPCYRTTKLRHRRHERHAFKCGATGWALSKLRRTEGGPQALVLRGLPHQHEDPQEVLGAAQRQAEPRPPNNQERHDMSETTDNSQAGGRCAPALGSGLLMQVLEDQRWVDVHNRCGVRSVEHAKRIYRRFLRDNEKNPTQPPVCGMRVISVHFEWLGHLPNDRGQARR